MSLGPPIEGQDTLLVYTCMSLDSLSCSGTARQPDLLVSLSL